ncbi:nucleotidyltransferase substrate binding protein [Cyanobium sp. BA20m-p-22]|uniref:nucleotidyltransferase substrate binding protein n=1 Tax=Cyanobium sp. BA20m-p-22 TaxID=2823704 RepID=UPI0020CDBE0B|nr:nucleotidyltransferase substrate binding protein [Cyanobium sp. BA20m-p-22]MCP9910085.1 nucleotidyltransferase substrate binding protein [Cyanobium sp. BA20m-p-22]
MTGADIRWHQRFVNFRQALARLRDAVELSQQRSLSEMERQGLIKAFEFTHELSWKTLKDFLVSRGVSDLFGFRATTREAFAQGLINDGETWMEMIRHRNLSAHTYDEATVLEIVVAVVTSYVGAFEELESRLQAQESLP